LWYDDGACYHRQARSCRYYRHWRKISRRAKSSFQHELDIPADDPGRSGVWLLHVCSVRLYGRGRWFGSACRSRCRHSLPVAVMSRCVGGNGLRRWDPCGAAVDVTMKNTIRPIRPMTISGAIMSYHPIALAFCARETVYAATAHYRICPQHNVESLVSWLFWVLVSIPTATYIAALCFT
jgi:hypothetical protein